MDEKLLKQIQARFEREEALFGLDCESLIAEVRRLWAEAGEWHAAGLLRTPGEGVEVEGTWSADGHGMDFHDLTGCRLVLEASHAEVEAAGITSPCRCTLLLHNPTARPVEDK